MNIREKLLDFKRRLSDRKMYSIVVVIIAVVAVFGLYQYRNASMLRQKLDNQYNRAFYDMTGYVNNVEVLLVKSMISASPTKTASLLQEAWRQANLAQTNLGQLPVSQQILSKTSKFLTQVGDLSYSLNNQNMQGKPLSEEQFKTLKSLHQLSLSLEKSLNDLQTQLNVGRLKWGELERKGTAFFKKASTNLTLQNFENINKIFQEYPTLIYDGPFSDHLATQKPKGLTGEKISSQEAKKKVQSFFTGRGIENITEIDKKNAGISTYSYKVTFKNAPKDQTATIDLTQTGGQIFAMLYPRAAAAEKLTVDQAKAAGKKYLEDHGFPGMKDTYYLRQGNVAVINYAYQQSGVIMYTDLIKVKVALDNGEIVGVETKGYLSAHTQRSLPEPKISLEQARAKINPKLNVTGGQLAIIPTDYRTELFTYEFKGKLDNQDFLVYINAETGKEENILMIIDTPNGILTM